MLAAGTKTVLAGIGPAAVLLLDALSLDATRFTPDRARALSLDEWVALGQFALRQRVGGMLSDRLAQRDLGQVVPGEVLRTLGAAARRTAIQNLRLQADLRAVVGALDAAGIDALVLKGPYLAESIYRSMTARAIGDIDLLVHSRQLREAGGILESLGYRPTAPYRIADDGDVPPYGLPHLPRFVKPGATPVELHFTIWTTGERMLDPGDLWRWATRANLTGREMFVLGAEARLVHVCVHAACQHEFACGLRPLCDIAAIVRQDRLDWDAVVRCARDWRSARGVGLILLLAAQFAGAAVPEAVVDRLCVHPPALDVQTCALAQMSVDAMERSIAVNMTADLAALRQNASRDNLARVWRRIFLPRAELAAMYGIDAHSRLRFAYYPIRTVQLALNHGLTVLRLRPGDQQYSRVADRKLRLHEWLCQAVES